MFRRGMRCRIYLRFLRARVPALAPVLALAVAVAPAPARVAA